MRYVCPVEACGKEYRSWIRRGGHVKVLHGLIENEYTGNWIQDTGSNRRRIWRMRETMVKMNSLRKAYLREARNENPKVDEGV